MISYKHNAKRREATSPENGTRIANGKAAGETRIDFDDAVREAKQIIEASEKDQWRLAELAAGVETEYGERKVQEFAKAIGVAFCTVDRQRTVWKAWHNNDEIQGPAPKSFAVAQALQAHPQRDKLVKKFPDLTRAKARELMQAYKSKSNNDGDKTNGNSNNDGGDNKLGDGKSDGKADAQYKNNERWFREVLKLANEAVRASGLAEGEVAPELLASLRAVVDPALVPSVRAGGEALIRLAGFLERVVAEPAQLLQAAE